MGVQLPLMERELGALWDDESDCSSVSTADTRRLCHEAEERPARSFLAQKKMWVRMAVAPWAMNQLDAIYSGLGSIVNFQVLFCDVFAHGMWLRSVLKVSWGGCFLIPSLGAEGFNMFQRWCLNLPSCIVNVGDSHPWLRGHLLASAVREDMLSIRWELVSYWGQSYNGFAVVLLLSWSLTFTGQPAPWFVLYSCGCCCGFPCFLIFLAWSNRKATCKNLLSCFIRGTNQLWGTLWPISYWRMFQNQRPGQPLSGIRYS